MFYFGIEHEVAFLNQANQFADFSCTRFREFQQIIDCLPTYPQDHHQLRVGDAGIKVKRWYIEGFERFTDSPQVVDCLVKGIEIRTTIHTEIDAAIQELTASFQVLKKIAADFGFTPILVSFSPHYASFQPEPALNRYELQQIQADPQNHADIHMVSYGPDLNLSIADLPVEKLIDAGQKLTYYSPYLVPFTYSSPFYCDRLWGGLSVRTFLRTGKRPATLVFVEKEGDVLHTVPPLTKRARLSAEIGRIEFKAFDSCADFNLYGALLALLKGLVLDQSLPGRAIIPDTTLHQRSAKLGFDDPAIFTCAQSAVQAAEIALENDLDRHLLAPLKIILQQRKTASHHLIDLFNRLGSMEKVLQAMREESYGAI